MNVKELEALLDKLKEENSKLSEQVKQLKKEAEAEAAKKAAEEAAALASKKAEEEAAAEAAKKEAEEAAKREAEASSLALAEKEAKAFAEKVEAEAEKKAQELLIARLASAEEDINLSGDQATIKKTPAARGLNKMAAALREQGL